jgi:hypothetical protein
MSITTHKCCRVSYHIQLQEEIGKTSSSQSEHTTQSRTTAPDLGAEAQTATPASAKSKKEKRKAKSERRKCSARELSGGSY